MPIQDDLLEILVCPLSKAELVYDEEGDRLISTDKMTRRRYTIDNDIPIMLADDPQILEARIPEPDLNLYDSLFEDKNHDPKDPDIQTPNDQDNKPADDPDQTRHP